MTSLATGSTQSPSHGSSANATQPPRNTCRPAGLEQMLLLDTRLSGASSQHRENGSAGTQLLFERSPSGKSRHCRRRLASRPDISIVGRGSNHRYEFLGAGIVFQLRKGVLWATFLFAFGPFLRVVLQWRQQRIRIVRLRIRNRLLGNVSLYRIRITVLGRCPPKVSLRRRRFRETRTLGDAFNDFARSVRLRRQGLAGHRWRHSRRPQATARARVVEHRAPARLMIVMALGVEVLVRDPLAAALEVVEAMHTQQAAAWRVPLASTDKTRGEHHNRAALFSSFIHGSGQISGRNRSLRRRGRTGRSRDAVRIGCLRVSNTGFWSFSLLHRGRWLGAFGQGAALLKR